MQRICEIVTSQQISDTSYAIAIDAGEMAQEAKPGQFLHILCGDRELLRRPISICDVSDGQIKVVFDVVGKGTKWLSQKKSGTLDIIGPVGNGFDIDGARILLVGGGIGVPPMLYASRMAPGITTAVLGFRSKSQVILEEQFKQLCSKVIVTTDDGSYGEAGFVTGPVQRLLDSGEYDRVLVCGPKMMLKSVAIICDSRRIPCQVSMEERMGCGIGACLVCACKVKGEGGDKYAHVCKDGPVFDSSEVIFNE